MAESVFWWLVGFIIVLTPIVIIHELGHFWAARLCKIRVEEFGFGLPPRALKIAERNGTIYSLNWIPVGGFVRPAGEDDPNVPGGLSSASKRARIFVLAAGAVANFIFAVLIFWIALVIGPPAVAIETVESGSPAMVAGFQAGDAVMQVNGERVNNVNVLVDAIYQNAGKPIEVVIKRNGQELTLTVVPRTEGEYDPATQGPLGVRLTDAANGERISMGPIEAIGGSFGFMWDYISLFGRLPSMLLSGAITPQEARPVSIVGIGQIAGQATQSSISSGNLYPLLSIAAFISVALGLTNLLPLPALDGGRILFVLIEAIRGRRIEPEREGMVHLIGMIVLLGLMALLVVQDFVNPIVVPQ